MMPSDRDDTPPAPEVVALRADVARLTAERDALAAKLTERDAIIAQVQALADEWGGQRADRGFTRDEASFFIHHALVPPERDTE